MTRKQVLLAGAVAVAGVTVFTVLHAQTTEPTRLQAEIDGTRNACQKLGATEMHVEINWPVLDRASRVTCVFSGLSK